MLEWLQENIDSDIPDVKKDTVIDLVKELENSTGKRVLEIRQELSKTSNKKYVAMDVVKGEDNRARGLLQFYGASRTGRWAGRLIQVQNLPRNHLDILGIARDLVKEKKIEISIG